MVNGIDNVFGIQAEALKLRAERAEVLANNLVNADTPNYKARDIDFKEAMANAVNQQSQTLSPVTTQSGHIGNAEDGALFSLKYRQPLQPSLDGNTVDMHVEQSEFARNALYYQAGLNFIEGKIRTMKSALSRE